MAQTRKTQENEPKVPRRCREGRFHGIEASPESWNPREAAIVIIIVIITIVVIIIIIIIIIVIMYYYYYDDDDDDDYLSSSLSSVGRGHVGALRGGRAAEPQATGSEEGRGEKGGVLWGTRRERGRPGSSEGREGFSRTSSSSRGF